VSWSPHRSFQDRLYDTNAAYNASRVGACDPTRADQVAVVWPVCVDGVKDSLYFDAEWRGGPGFPNLEPGFPLALAAGVRSPLGICELDGDSESELVFGDTDGNIQVRHHDGTSLPGWPIDIGDIAPDSPVAVGDLDGDGVNEIVCGNTAGIIHAFRPDGSPFPGWPVDTGYPDSVYVSIGALTPVSHRQVVACVDNRIFLLSAAGAVQTPFPMKAGGSILCSAAIGDMDRNGYGDIVILQRQFMDVINGNGTVLGFRNFVALGKTFSNSPTLADLDGDGDLEIAAPTEQGDLYVLHADGTDFPGFPITEPGGRPLSSVAMAQIRGTTNPELVYSVDDATAPRVNARYATGVALGGYPTSTGVGWRLPGQPVLDVLDGGSPDVVVGARDMKAYAWDNFGFALPGWPTELAGQFNSSPASGDIDADGDVEVVLAAWDPAILVVIDLGAPVIRGGVHRTWYWPMYAYNPERQGCLACGEDAVVSVPETPGPAGSVRFAPPLPNPSGGPVALAFELPARAAVALTVFDVAGRRVRELVRSELGPGRHALTWDGRDEGGAAAAAGIYYARLAVDAPVGGEPLVRKITLLR
jgi:hypothetical protein